MRHVAIFRSHFFPLTSFALSALLCAVAGCSSDAGRAADPEPEQAPTHDDTPRFWTSDGGSEASTLDAELRDGPAAPREAGSSQASCLPQKEPDRPDDFFADTNCDGIDGDRAMAIFVSPSGKDDEPGTIDHPVASVSKAIELASAQNKDVYLCNATYTESLKIAAHGVSLYGGFDCANGWARTTDSAVIAPVSGRALVIDKVAAPMTVARVGFKAADATESGGSAIAVEVWDSPSVQFAHVQFEAGAGGDGANGAPVTSNAEPAFGGVGGQSLVVGDCTYRSGQECLSGGRGGEWSPLFACTRGGTGGVGGVGSGVMATDGQPGFPGGGQGGHRMEGLPGSAGAMGAAGTIGRASAGTIIYKVNAQSEYASVGAGADGSMGDPGQAGGGGSGGVGYCKDDVCSRWVAGGGGGQGGFGGCGGGGGKAGGAGGASLALLLVHSPASLDRCSITTGNGGRGGAPSAGGAGQPGGRGGVGGSGTGGATPGGGKGFDGGHGGAGGRGGPGSPGAGGPSIGILYRGPKPEIVSPIYHIGIGGKGGKGLADVDGADGVTGDAVPLDGDVGRGTPTGGN